MLRLHAVRFTRVARKVSQVAGNDSIRVSGHCDRQNVAVLRVVGHPIDQMLVPGGHRLLECLVHEHDAPLDRRGLDRHVSAYLIEDLVRPARLEHTLVGEPEQQIAERVRNKDIRV